jgi:ABC-type dipeptide/oligopeptide/nickel transport system permease subunit
MSTDPGRQPPRAEARLRPRSVAIERFRRDRAAMLGAATLTAIAALAVLAPLVELVTGHPADRQYLATGLTPQGLPTAPSAEFWLGTDDLGRDLLVRIAYGGRTSLLITALATVLTVAIGVVVGLASGLLGGIVDAVLARVADAVLAVPVVMAALALVAVTGPSLPLTVAVIALSAWAGIARSVRGQVMSLRGQPFVDAARSLGASSGRIMAHHLLPNVLSPVLVYAALMAPGILLFEASLSFLGLGVQPPTPDWGEMISSGQAYYTTAWWYLLCPTAMVVATTTALCLVADGIHDAVDPRGVTAGERH